jgi:hypothetical protein
VKYFWVLLLVCGFALSGCDGGTVTKGVHGECQHADPGNPTADCLLTIDSIDGTIYTYPVKDDNFRSAVTATAVKIKIAVGAGELAVGIEDPHGEKISKIVTGGQTAELDGLAHVWGSGDDLSFKILLEPRGEIHHVEDVRIEFSYTSPGL